MPKNLTITITWLRRRRRDVWGVIKRHYKLFDGKRGKSFSRQNKRRPLRIWF